MAPPRLGPGMPGDEYISVLSDQRMKDYFNEVLQWQQVGCAVLQLHPLRPGSTAPAADHWRRGGALHR